MRYMHLALGLLAVILLTGCPPRAVEVPSDVFTLQDEVIAVQARGRPGEIRKNKKISLKRLRRAVGEFNEVILLEYGFDKIEQIPHRWEGKDIVADLVGGQTYVIFAEPKIRLVDNYYVLCKFDLQRVFVDRVGLDFVGNICPLILCPAELFRADTLFDKFRELEPIRTELDFGDRNIGGWDPGGPINVCDRCTSLRRPGRIYPIPVKECWVRPPPAVINMIPRSLGGETNQDSEPFLAVNPDNPQLMAGSAFTPDPDPSSDTAPIFVTENRGDTWRLNSIVPSLNMTCDITLASTGSTATLYAGILRRHSGGICGPPTKQDELATNNFLSSTTMNVQAGRDNPDQPFLQAAATAGQDRVYVGTNDFSNWPNTATVDVSLDGGANWNSVRIAFRGCNPQCGPSVRPAIANDGTVYAAYFGWQSFTGTVVLGTATGDVVVVRDDNGAAGPNPFRDLLGSDGKAGRRVVQDRTFPWANPWPNPGPLGQERLGSTLSIAVDPNNTSTVYIAWADRVGTGDIYTVHVRRSTDRGVTWSGDLRTLTNATNPALAIADNGTVGLLYQQVNRVDGRDRWVTHLEQTRNAFATIQDAVLATVPADTPPMAGFPYLGDYDFLLAVGSQFRGVFSANNTPDLANFPSGVKFQRKVNFTTHKLLDNAGNPVAVSIDPFYFRVPVIK